MPATRSQLRRPVIVEHKVDFGDGVEVMFRYDRNKITDAWVREWTRHEEEQNAGALNEVLGDLIEAWDVLNDDGTPCPITADMIGELLSYPDKIKVLQELMTASVPSRAEGNASSASSASPSTDSMQEQPSSPNGSDTSGSPSVSESLSPT